MGSSGGGDSLRDRKKVYKKNQPKALIGQTHGLRTVHQQEQEMYQRDNDSPSIFDKDNNTVYPTRQGGVHAFTT